MALSATAAIHIPFHDIDVLHIAWHGHYLKYFELARTVLMQKAGLDWPALREQKIAMPMVEAHVQYRRPLLYDQRAVVEAKVEDYAFAELVIHYQIRSDEGKGLSSGWTRQVYMNFEDRSSFFVVPDFVRERFAALETIAAAAKAADGGVDA